MRVTAVLRFWYQGKLVDRGEEIEVDESVGRDVIQSGKAVLAELRTPSTAVPPKAKPEKAPPT